MATLRVPELLSDSHHDSQFADVHSNHGGYWSLKDKACLDKLEIPTIVVVVEGREWITIIDMHQRMLM